MTVNIKEAAGTAVSAAVTNVKKFAIPLLFGVFIIAILCGIFPVLKKFIQAY